jgi:alkylation response protein AidB-like acyl-CoA dehydrogenase
MTTHFTMNAVIRAEGQPLAGEDGAPRIRAFIVPAAQVVVHENWHTVGLVATASHSFSLDNARVDANQAFDLTPAAARAGGPLYRFPFLSLAFVTLAANVSGMALDFIEQAKAIIGRRRHHVTNQPLAELAQVRDALAHAPDAFERERTCFYEQLDSAWDKVCRGEQPSAQETAALHRTSLAMVDAARRAVDELYPLCGLSAADQRSAISRAWRDLHTASQHALMLPIPA